MNMQHNGSSIRAEMGVSRVNRTCSRISIAHRVPYSTALGRKRKEGKNGTVEWD